MHRVCKYVVYTYGTEYRVEDRRMSRPPRQLEKGIQTGRAAPIGLWGEGPAVVVLEDLGGPWKWLYTPGK